MRLLAFHAGVLAVFWGTLFVYALHGALPFNPIVLPLEDTVMVSRFLPQGWAFFTRNPREDRVTSHRLLPDGHLEPFSRMPHARWHNALGLNRRSRTEAIEVGLIIAAAREHARDPWVPCEGSESPCGLALKQRDQFFAVRNPAPRPTLCGRLVLKRQASVPWAWSQSPPQMPSKLLAVDVAC